MAMNRKYSALPDLDTAPDIYETPELTDDNSTVLTTTGRSPSDDESDADEDVETGISRSHVQVDQARSRFLGANVDTRGVDFSDRVDGKRKAYRTTTRRRRTEEGAEELGDLSDEDDDDNLERKIARLKREVEETKEAYNKQKAEKATTTTTAAAPDVTAETDLDALSQALDDMAALADGQALHSIARPLVVPASVPSSESKATSTTQAAAATPAPAAHPLVQVADFDRRLVLLERSIGIGSSALLPELGNTGGAGAAGALPRAILPTLDVLQRQVATLADASTASLDGISRRVRALTQEADQLTKARKAAKAAQEALAQAGVGVGGGGGAAKSGGGNANAAHSGEDDDDDQTSKVNALYGTLPTIEALTPLLPPLLDRLRSLQTVHADAAAAAGLLDDLEQRQAEAAAEIKQWREGLDKIEAALQAGEATMGRNAAAMEGWVRGLEARLDKLA